MISAVCTPVGEKGVWEELYVMAAFINPRISERRDSV